MKTINKFNEKGDFILWRDPMAGSDMYRESCIPAGIVGDLVQWVVVEHKPLHLFPNAEVSREIWGEIWSEIILNDIVFKGPCSLPYHRRRTTC